MPELTIRHTVGHALTIRKEELEDVLRDYIADKVGTIVPKDASFTYSQNTTYFNTACRHISQPDYLTITWSHEQ